MRRVSARTLDAALAVAALIAIAVSLLSLRAADAGLEMRPVTIGETPATLFRRVGAPPAPVIVIAHGFAGSQQLMQSFAVAFAQAGYVALTFDFPGHGRNPAPLTGSITEESGATRALVEATARAAEFARPLGDGRLAVLGHSMASDIVVRYAQQTPDVAATVAVSMFSPAVTAASPRDLLVITGGWETLLQREALRAVSLSTAPQAALPGVTYGDIGAGTARRAAFIPGTEHISVLYSGAAMEEALRWLNAVFARSGGGDVPARGPWIALLLAGLVLLARPLSGFLPVVTAAPPSAGLSWRRLWPCLVAPAVLTPLALRVLPTHFLPVLVGDYLAAHFALYGLVTLACAFLARHPRAAASAPVNMAALGAAVLLAGLYCVVLFGYALDTYVASFAPGRGRLLFLAAMTVGALLYFVSDATLLRAREAPRGAHAAAKAAFLASLALAVALDPGRLFFLIIIVPVIVIFFLIYGAFGAWITRRTGHPLPAALVNAAAFAWAISATFPLLAG